MLHSVTDGASRILGATAYISCLHRDRSGWMSVCWIEYLYFTFHCMCHTKSYEMDHIYKYKIKSTSINVNMIVIDDFCLTQCAPSSARRLPRTIHFHSPAVSSSELRSVLWAVWNEINALSHCVSKWNQALLANCCNPHRGESSLCQVIWFPQKRKARLLSQELDLVFAIHHRSNPAAFRLQFGAHGPDLLKCALS